MGNAPVKLIGWSRVKEVYSVWFIISLVLVAGMVTFKLRIPEFLFWLSVIFLIKDIVIDYELIHFKRPRVYWAEHAPIGFLLAVVGLGGYFSPLLFGYVTYSTAAILAVDFLLDLYKDLTEDPAVYKN